MQPAARWRPVGTVLVDNGSITQEQLDAALAEQRRTGKKIGEILIGTGAIDWLTLAHAIAEQAEDMNRGTLPAAPPPPPVSPAEPPLSPAPPVSPPLVEATREPAAERGDDSASSTRLQEVETLLRERQKAFLDLVSVTESLRTTVARLQDELQARNHELARLRAGRA